MSKLRFRETTELSGKLNSFPDGSPVNFQITLEEVAVSLSMPDANTVVAETDFLEVSDPLFHSITTESTLPEILWPEMEVYRNALREGTTRLVHIVKYALGNFGIEQKNESTKDKEQYSVDGTNWLALPHGKITGEIGVRSKPVFTLRDLPFIQEMLEDSPPLLLTTALYHLHRAKGESSQKHAIIDACIAVEVGIKEFLMVLKPELKTLLEKMPSPPVPTLYGDILESLIKVRFPHANKLRELIELRNKFVHTPTAVDVPPKEVRKMVLMAERAIYWLQIKLDPKNIYFPNLYQCTDVAIEDIRKGTLTMLRGVVINRPDEFPPPKGFNPDDWLRKRETHD